MFLLVRENMSYMDHYEILEVSPQATQSEIKFAYYRLSKELHPDKIPSDTPERARKILEENYKEINEAYGVLKDIDLRKEYDRQFYNSTARKQTHATQEERQDDCQHKYNYQSEYSEFLFDEEKMKLVAEALKSRISKVEERAEKRYAERIYFLERELWNEAQKIGYKGNIENILSTLGKQDSIKHGILSILLGLFFFWIVVGVIQSFLGIFLIFNGIVRIIYSVQMSASRNRKIITLKNIAAITKEQQMQALKQKEEEILQYKNKINHRIQHFKTIPSYSIDREFFKSLSSEDRLLLLVSLHQNSGQLDQDIQTMVVFVAALGLSFIFGNN
jgi:curved DNA-binding protein CbpA